MTRRIAVAIDFSDHSERALEEALALARKLGAEVHMVHVLEDAGHEPKDGLVPLGEIEKLVRAGIVRRFSEIHAIHDGRGVPLSQSVLDGSPSEAICRAADELGCQTIVMGTHGRTGFSRFFLGSVAEKVIRNAGRDVLVSRGGAPRRGYRRILVPTDFSAPAERALARAVEIAEPGAELDLFHVWQLPGPVRYQYAPFSSYPEALKEIARNVRARAKKRAAPLISKYERAGIQIKLTAVKGSPRPAIVDRSAGNDIVVMGTHGRRGFARFALGSVAEKTIRRAACSVLVTCADDAQGETS